MVLVLRLYLLSLLNKKSLLSAINDVTDFKVNKRCVSAQTNEKRLVVHVESVLDIRLYS